MNKYNIITLIALLVMVIAVPIYALREPERLETSQEELRQEFVADASIMYVENCAVCHGAAGEGIGSMPALNSDVLREADYDFIYKTIERGRYDTVMTGWHVEEGGLYNEYQIDELVALIRYADWGAVGDLAVAEGKVPPVMPVPVIDEAMLADITALAPEGSEWAAGIQLYANNCTVCHGVNGEGSTLAVPLNDPIVRATDAAELTRIITEGVPGTMMTGWSSVLSPDETGQIVSFLQNWDIIGQEELVLIAPEPVQIDMSDPEQVVAIGEQIFNTTCTSCHGVDGSGGTGPALNSQQFLTSKTNDDIINTVINGGHRPNTTMPAFGDRFSNDEILALTEFIRAWEPTAPTVENPRGTEQGQGGPPWASEDANSTNTQGNGNGNGGNGNGGGGNGQGGPAWRTDENSVPPGQSGTTGQGETAVSPTQGDTLFFDGTVVIANENNLIFSDSVTGEMHEAMLGPPFFWTESGIALNPGDSISLEGFESTEHMEINWLTNHTTGEMIELRTADGMPVWTQ